MSGLRCVRPRCWCCSFLRPIRGCCARGAVRVSSTAVSGKQVTLTYVEPGIWFGDVAMFDGDRRTHDAYAHGDSTILCVARADFQKILAAHVELNRDRLMTECPAWFQALVACELAFQLPFFFVAAYAFSAGKQERKLMSAPRCRISFVCSCSSVAFCCSPWDRRELPADRRELAR